MVHALQNCGSRLRKIAKEYAGKLIVAKVNTDDVFAWAVKFGV